MAWKHFPHYWPSVRGITFGRWIPLVMGHYDETLGGLSWTNFWKQNSPVVGDLRVMILDAMTPHDVTEIYNLIHILKM